MDSRFLAGLGISAISFFLRYAVKDMPRPIAWLGVVFGLLIMVVSTESTMAKYINGPLIMLGIGVFCIFGGALWFFFGDFSKPAFAETQVAQSTPSITQNNKSGPNLNVPGSNNQFNFYERAPNASSDGVIYQAGVAVGKVFGGRRLPTDATTFEFVEITNANQFNPREPFKFNDVVMLFQSTQRRSGMDISRSQDGMIYGGVVAKVIQP